jgi:hypothetical protein
MKPVVGFEKLYRVTAGGNIYSIKAGRYLKQSWHRNGYKLVRLYKDGQGKTIKVHRIVAEAFHGPAPEGKGHVNHKDSVRSNNHYRNLEWCNNTENINHRLKKWYRIEHADGRVAESNNLALLCRAYGIHPSNLSRVLHGTRTQAQGWKCVSV